MTAARPVGRSASANEHTSVADDVATAARSSLSRRATDVLGPAVAVPSAAWLLPQVGVGFPAAHRDAADALRALVHGTLVTLAGARVVVLVVDDRAPHPRATVAPRAPLAPLGLPRAPASHVPPEVSLAWSERLAAALPVPHDDTVVVGPQERVLRHLLAGHAATVDATVVAVDLGPPRSSDEEPAGSPTAVASDRDPSRGAPNGATPNAGTPPRGTPTRGTEPSPEAEVLLDVLTGLGPVVGEPMGLVAPGDLTAGWDEESPRAQVPGAAGASSELAEAVATGRPHRSSALPDARALAMPGLRPLTALLDVLPDERRVPEACHDLRVRHVHHLCAAWPSPR